MKFFRSIAFRIWISFTGLGLLVSVPLALYYNNLQFSLLQEHTRKEFNVNSRITANAVKTAIETDNFEILTTLLKDINKESNYEYVAIIEIDESGKKSVFSCTPERFKNDALNAKEDQFYYSRSPFATEILKGEILLASSKAEDLRVLNELNQPLIYLTVIAVMGSVVLFALSILFLSRPIFKSVEIANQLGKRNYQVDIHHMSGKNEIAVLNNALYKLKQDLIELETENKHFMEGLADRIKTITQDIEQKNKLNQLLLGVSRLFLEKGEEQDLQSVILETFFQISQGLELQYIGIFQIQESRLTCQYNAGDGPLKSAANQPFDPLELSNLLTSVSSLTVFTKEQGAQNPILSRFFAKLPESKTIYLQAFSEGGGPQELLMLVSESMPDRRHWGELENMLKVYLSLYTNFRKGRQFAGELKELNKTLEAKVLEKTRINLEISNSLIAQDKLVTIGELSAGVAHDLNTPLGSIKAAAQNLKLIVLDLLPRLNELDTQDLNFAIHFARTYPEQSALLNSSEKMKRAEGLREAISRHSQRTDLLELSKLFAEAGFNPQQDKEISEVLAKVDPIAILKAIKDLHLLDAFLTGIESSVDRSSQVITNLNRFVREDLTQKKELIDLSNSIRIVETLFRFRLRGHIDLITEIQPGSTIMGVEMKLFQVWTNIVKNAIDAFEEQTENANKYIKIFTEVNPEQVIIHFENNGPRIPEDEVQRIFRKFYTTKQKRNGTGLGLSIVSNILAEHYGKISVQSDDQKTTFSIGFPRAEA